MIEPWTRWTDRTAPELRALAADDPVAVLPLAAVEQHGPHLPLSTDADIGRGILAAALRRLPAGFGALVLPMQTVGASPEHADVAGTLDLGPRGAEETLVALGASVARARIRRLVVFNSHGGNKAVVDTAALRLRREFDLLVVKAHWFRFPRPEAGLPAAEWEHGLHGGAVETAMMLHLHPERVRAAGLDAFRSLGQELESRLVRVRPEGPVAFAWTARDLNPRGVTGDATLADAETGRILVEHYGEVLAEVLADARAFPLDRLGGGGV